MNTNLQTVSARDLQKGYRKIFDRIKSEGEPVFVMSRNKPDVVIVSLDYLNNLKDQIEYEMTDTRKAVTTYEKEKRSRKLKTLNKPSQLLSL